MFGTAAHERTDHWGPWDCRCSGTLKRLNNRKASCYTLRKRITSSTAQGGGGSFKNRKPIGEVGGCESGMAERSH